MNGLNRGVRIGSFKDYSHPDDHSIKCFKTLDMRKNRDRLNKLSFYWKTLIWSLLQLCRWICCNRNPERGSIKGDICPRKIPYTVRTEYWFKRDLKKWSLKRDVRLREMLPWENLNSIIGRVPLNFAPIENESSVIFHGIRFIGLINSVPNQNCLNLCKEIRNV